MMNVLAQRTTRKRLCRMIAVLLAVPAAALVLRAQAAEGDTDVPKLTQEARCFVCHDMTKTDLLGPPYKAIATRYANENPEIMADVLAQKIVEGGGVNWGTMVMPPNDQRIDLKQARILARWVLNQK
jgi:cytochrome c